MESEQREKPPVQVPQYEEYRPGSWLGALSQWSGGIGMGILALLWMFWPELLADRKWAALWAGSVLLAMFLIPAIHSRRRSRENQAISRRNRRKYDQYCQSLKSEQES